MKLNTLEIRGRKIDIFVAPDGEFSAEYNGQTAKAPTLPLLKEKLERIVKADKIAPIRFILFEEEKLKRGSCTGIHVGNGNLLVKWEGEKGVEQEYRVTGALEPEHFAAYKKLCDAEVAATDLRKAYVALHGFDDLKERVKQAIAAAIESKP